MPLDGSGCHVRLSRFLFLFFSFFFLPCPVATVSKADERTGTFSGDHLRTIETTLPFFSASLHREKSVRRTKRRIRLSRRLGSFPILSDTYRFYDEKRSFDSKEALWPIKRFILETRSSGTSLCPNFPLCRPCRCRFRASLETRPRDTIQSV